MQFNGVCRRTLPFEDKVKVNSLNNMEGMNRAYLMATSKSPEKILNLSKEVGGSQIVTGLFEQHTSMTMRESVELTQHQSELRQDTEVMVESLNAIAEDDGTPVVRKVEVSVSDLSRPVTKEQKKSVDLII